MQVDTIYVASLLDFFKENDVIKFSAIGVAGLVVGGLIFEVYWRMTEYMQKQKQRAPEIGDEVYDNGSAKENVERPKNSTKLELEVMRLRTDVATVKDHIVKLSTMSQYNQKCSVCSWQT